MGNKKHKKRNPATNSPISSPISSNPTKADIKWECERSLTALRHGNQRRALRLMHGALAKHSDSALLHRVYGTVNAKLACLVENPFMKQRHHRAAIESAKKATELSPDSVEFACFYANLLFDCAELEHTGYELAMTECERALMVENPVDPALDRISNETMLSTSEERINQVKTELRNLVQKCYLILNII